MPSPRHRLPVLSRRDLLGLTAAGVGAALPGCRDAPTASADASADALSPDAARDGASDRAPCDAAVGSFFSECERDAVVAFADRLLPPDAAASATALGVVTYLEALLTAFESTTPRIFADGPFSGRAPLGTSGVAHDFERFLPLDRVSTVAWRLRLYGSDATPEAPPNTTVTGRVEGLRPMFRRVLATVTPSALRPEAIGTTWSELPRDFRDAFAELVMEAAFCAPEYGGNRDRAGWRMVHFEGDVQPRGHSQWDGPRGMYTERPEAPVSTRDPGPDPDPLSDESLGALRTIVLALGGRVHA